jgi:hypothetical protein
MVVMAGLLLLLQQGANWPACLKLAMVLRRRCAKKHSASADAAILPVYLWEREGLRHHHGSRQRSDTGAGESVRLDINTGPIADVVARSNF